MMKQHLFVAAAILAAGLLLSGCDLFGAPGNGGGETSGELTITGPSSENREVKVIFTAAKSSGGAAMTAPETGDTYRIVYDNKDVSKGSVEVRGNIITFKPSSGASFDAILGKSGDEPTLNFPGGIIASDETIIEYVNHNVINPSFTNDLNDPTVTLSVGQTRLLAVLANANGGGTLSYQWYKAGSTGDSGTPIQGATSSSYTVSATAPATAYYYVMVTNASGGLIKSKVVTVQVGSAINITAGGNGTRFSSLPDVIEAMLGSSTDMPYTVTFAEDPGKMLFISDKTFPGTGKVTINSTVPLTKGIHITRSNVELNGLSIFITEKDGNPLIDSQNCAVLISKRFNVVDYVSTNMIPGKPTENMEFPETNDGYNKFYPNNTINNVEIVNCNISFVVSGNNNNLHGIYVDHRTSGRLTDRVKIKNTTVNVAADSSAYCFSGNLADLSGNTFTSTNINGVVSIYCIFGLLYGGSDATISFTNNQFNASKDSRLAYVVANAWYDIKGNTSYSKLAQKIGSTPGFGNGSYAFSNLPTRYQNLIKDLFAQTPSTDGRYITLEDIAEGMDSSDTTITPTPNKNPKFEDYVKVMGNYSVKVRQ